MNILEKLRYDMENCFPEDKESIQAVCSLLYKFAWKVKEEKDQN